MYTLRILMTFGVLLLIATYIDAFNRMQEANARKLQLEQEQSLQERRQHCKMLWGDSPHFDTCVKGDRVIPSSGMI